MNRRGSLAPVILLAVAMAAGVSVYGGTGAPPASGAAAWSLPSGPVSITYWDGGDSTKSTLIQKYLAAYGQMHPNIKINFETDVPSTKVSVALSTGTAPALFEVADWNLP